MAFRRYVSRLELLPVSEKPPRSAIDPLRDANLHGHGPRLRQADHANLIAVIPRAATSDPGRALSLVTDLNNTYLHERRHFHDAAALSEYALATARELGDRSAEGWSLNTLGVAPTVTLR